MLPRPAWADLEQALAPDGALKALQTAREEGKVRFLGITGHSRPEILGKALELYPFDTVLVALGAADRLVTSPETFCLPQAQQHRAGVIAMKVFGHGEFKNRSLCLRYSLNLPAVSLAIIGLDDKAQIDELVKLTEHLEPLNAYELEQITAEVRPLVEADASSSKQGWPQSTVLVA